MIRALSVRRVIVQANLPFLLAVATLPAIDPAFSNGSRAAEVAANMPKDEFERRVHDYLTAHPEVVGEAIRAKTQ